MTVAEEILRQEIRDVLSAVDLSRAARVHVAQQIEMVLGGGE